MDTFTEIAYIAAAILFILGIKLLGSATTARRGNLISAVGMLLAVVVTLLPRDGVGLSYTWIAVGIGIGAVIGGIAAKRVQMTGMPELVALFNGFGGLASLLVAWASYHQACDMLELEFDGRTFWVVVTGLAMLIGGVTFTGSLIAYLKLSGKPGSKFSGFPKQRLINFAVMAAAVVLIVMFALNPGGGLGYTWVALLIVVALVLGVFGTAPIGGGDMPVVIALLNSFSGLAASAAGFVIGNNVLVVAGCLVGASGLILTIIMCKAMNRSLPNVLFGSFGAATGKTGAAVEGEMKAMSVEDAYYVLEAAESVVFVPGYGMAVAQAQHVVKELSDILERNGAEVRHAIHPVAGRIIPFGRWHFSQHFR